MPLPAATTVFLILLGWILTVITSCLLGRLVLAHCLGPRMALSRAERLVFAFGAGAACLSNVVFLMCSLGAFYTEAVWAVALLAAGAYWRWGREGSSTLRFPAEPGQRLWWAIFAIPAVAYGCTYFVHAMAPEISPDGVGYHLGLVSRYYREHGFPHITTNIYAYLSQGAEMLYLFAFAVGKHSAAKLVHFSFLVATVGAMLAFSRRHGLWRAGVVGAILYACSPVVGADAASTYNDCALAFYEFSAFYALLLWWRGRQRGWLVIIGILAGFCFSIKYTGGLMPPAVVALVAWGSWRRLRNARAALTRSLAVAAVASLPWTLKNAILVPVDSVFEPALSQSLRHGFFRGLLPELLEGSAIRASLFRPMNMRSNSRFGEPSCKALGPIFLITPLGFLAALGETHSPGGVALRASLANAGTRFLTHWFSHRWRWVWLCASCRGGRFAACLEDYYKNIMSAKCFSQQESDPLKDYSHSAEPVPPHEYALVAPDRTAHRHVTVSAIIASPGRFELVSQRVYGLALGYEDLNDHDQLRSDPLLALLSGKQDLEGKQRRRAQDRGNPGAGKSTLNRLEGTPADAGSQSRYKKIVLDTSAVERLLTDLYIQSQPRQPKRIVLDLDATDDPLHGHQEERFFHGSGLPLLAAGGGAGGNRIVAQLRRAWPEAEILLRADSGFCRDEIMSWCEANLVSPRAAPRRGCPRAELGAAAAVVGKAESLAKGENPRFVVTSLDGNAGTRFLIPALVFASLAVGLALCLLPRRIRITARKVWISLATGYPWAGEFEQVYANLLRVILEADRARRLEVWAWVSRP